jgi:hypothetical protein
MSATEFYVVASPRHWSTGPFHHIEGLDPEVDVLPWPAEQSAAYDIDDEVIPASGVFAGQLGVVDELDLADDDKPFRVRFQHVDGEPIAWFNAQQLQPAGGAR